MNIKPITVASHSAYAVTAFQMSSPMRSIQSMVEIQLTYQKSTAVKDQTIKWTRTISFGKGKHI